MSKKTKITVENREISLLATNQSDFISLTDIAKYKSEHDPNDVIKNWMRGKSTISFLGLWEVLNNVDFKPVEFDGFKNEAGYNHFVLSPQRWKALFPKDSVVFDNALLMTNIEHEWKSENLLH